MIELQEWKAHELTLEASEVAELQAIPARLAIQPSGARFIVTPHSIVGSATTANLHVYIEPKLEFDQVLALVAYARKFQLASDPTPLAERKGIVEAFVAGFLQALEHALRHGLLLSYVTQEEALPTIRGRVRFAEQLRRRYGMPLPVEISYDDYTVDTEANRLIKAALRRITRLRLRDPRLQRRAAQTLAVFDTVSDVIFHPHRLPTFAHTRLTARFRPVLELAALLVRNTSVELEPGKSPFLASMLFNMDDVFEDFVWAAIGEELRRILPVNYRWMQGAPVALDRRGLVKPEPDLSLWHRPIDRPRGRWTCVFVGDAKYKTTTQGGAGDLYQLLAYCSATGLDQGLLLYAEKPVGPTAHSVVHDGPLLRVESVDVTAPLDVLIGRCRSLAEEIAATVTEAVETSGIAHA